MIKDVLKNKLKSIGYIGDKIEEEIEKMDFSILVSNDIKEDDIEVIKYESPDAEIERAFLNTDSKYVKVSMIDGEADVKTVPLPTGEKMTLLDFYLDKKLCLVLITIEMKIEIVFYSPNDYTKSNYNNKKYNDVYSKEREGIIQDYLTEFISSNRLTRDRAIEVMDMLSIDFVIDEMVIKNSIPVLKLYNSPENFAEKITAFEFKYINRKINRIEIAEKSIFVKRKSKNVKCGFLSNDPYIRLNELNNYANFNLNTVSYFWLYSNERGQEEIGIYIPTDNTMRGYYSDTTNLLNDKLDEKAREISIQFTNQLGFPISEDVVKEVLKKVNIQLVVPPIDIILKYAENPNDPIEPLSYKYRATTDPSDFEKKLYNSIEDNIGRRYKFKMVEKVLEDLTSIGNKLDYTTSDGKIVKKQSIADFNQNNSSVVIRRETLIDETVIPDLLGYIYDDIENHGTSSLPVPSIELDFYFSTEGFSRNSIKMYNGTDYENISDKVLSGYIFSAIDDVQNIFTGQAQLDGSTKVIVRYVARNGILLRENKIGNIFPGDTYIPEILPIITDKNGREWTYKETNVPRLTVTSDESNNVIELEYIEKTEKVKINFISTIGKKLSESKIIDMQIGSEINKDEYLTVVDGEGTEWNYSRLIPERFVVSENESKNEVSIVYDVIKVDVTINYINTVGQKIKEPNTIKAIANKKLTANIDGIIEDSDGLSWVYISNSAATIVPQENVNNVVNLVYDEMKVKVVTSFENIDGEKILDDIVEFIQVGKQYSPGFETKVIDFNNKVWKFNTLNNQKIIVKPNEDENKLLVKYEPVYSKVTIKTISNDGKILGRDLIEKIQVGSVFSAKDIEILKDINQKIWKCNDNKLINIKEDEKENIIELVYEPLLVRTVIKYLDDENNEIVPSKILSIQAGSMFKPEMPSKLDDSEGKRWRIIEKNEKEFEIKEQEENNKISIYYEKELTDIKLSFRDLYSNKLIDDVVVKWQIGSEYTSRAYEKIKDSNGARWSITSSDPKNMIVKEKYNNFTLIYDEIRTKVVIRYLNITDNTAIKEPDIITVKLGVGYIPNIQREFIDNNRLSWNYVGEKEISIITKEEEQDNIIVLKYEPHNAKVSVRYLDINGNKIIEDNVKEMQVGREVQIKGLDKIYSKDNFGYKLETISNKTIRVSDDESKNIIDSVYVPLLGKIITLYKNAEGADIIKPISKEQQVGSTFNAEIIDKVIDDSGKFWNYVGDEKITISVKDGEECINLKYEPEFRKVKLRFVGDEGQELLPSAIETIQVGEKFIPKYEKIITDVDGRVWEFDGIDKKEIVVKENEEDNIITLSHNKKMIDVAVSFLNDASQQVKPNDCFKAQLGSIYKYETNATIVDKEGLGWKTDEVKSDLKITEDNTKFVISFEPYLVNVFSRCVDGDNKDIIDPVMYKKQVGTKFEPEIKEELTDVEGKEWLYVDENKLFGKSNSIRVSASENENNILVKYKPSFANVEIEYLDPLGASIKAKTTVQAQIGSIYSADVIERITDRSGTKWLFNPNTKNEVKVKREGTTLALSYEEQKAVVIYKYQDEYGNRLKTPKKGLAQVGMTFKPDVDSVIEDDQERVWEYIDRDIESIEIKDTEQDNVFVLTYTPLKVDVDLIINDNLGNELMSPVIVKAQLGSEFAPNIDNNITDAESLLYKFKKIEPQSIKVKENPIGNAENINKFVLTYEPVNSTVSIRYQDIDGNLLRETEQVQLQVGTLFTPKKHQFIKDKKDNQWQLIDNEDISIRVKENIKENTIKFVYEIAKADVVIRFKDTEGNDIQKEEIVNLQIGTEFVPKPTKYLFDADNKKWIFFSSEPVNLKVGSINNVVNILYQEEKTNVIIKYTDDTGKQLKADDRVLVQIGSVFVPKISSKVMYDENEIWRFSHFSPKEIVVSENSNENIITQVYTNKKNDENKYEPAEMTEEKSENTEIVTPSIVSELNETNEEPQEKTVEEITEEQGYTYKNEKLKDLDKIVLLSDEEKMTFDEINSLNNSLISDLVQSAVTSDIVPSVEEIIDKEKQLVNDNLSELITKDKSGSKLLRLLEISLVPTDNTIIVETLQKRKALAMADYFLNKPLTDADQALYIFSKGKNDKQIEIINSITNRDDDINEIAFQVCHEKMLLENYYRAKNSVKDNYFIDNSSKEQVSQEISVIISNMITNQTYNLLIKNDLSIYQKIELKALGKLLNQLQRENLTQKINKISDIKQRKNLLKLLQSI